MLTANVTIYLSLGRVTSCLLHTVFPTMGNLPSIFCPSESNSQCIGQDSLLLIPTSSFGVMLTPSEGHVLTHDALHGSSTNRPDPSSINRTPPAFKRPPRHQKSFGSSDRTDAQHKPTNSLPKHLRFKQSNARGPLANRKAPSTARGNRQAPSSARGNRQAPSSARGNRQAPSSARGNRQAPSSAHGNRLAPHQAKHSSLHSTKTKSASPRFVRSTIVGPAPKRSRKWNKRRDAKVQRDQLGASAIRDDYDLVSKTDLDLFTSKVDALNAHLDSVYGKDEAHPAECRENDEDARNRILITNRRVV